MTYAGSWFGAVPSPPSGIGSAGQFGAAEIVAIASNVAVMPASHSRNLLLAGQGGVADDLVSIAGYAAGDMIVIAPANDGVAITIKNDDDYLNLQGVDFIMNNANDSMILLNNGSNKWRELSRSAN